MKVGKKALILSPLILIVAIFFPFNKVFASELVIKGDGKVQFIKNSGEIEDLSTLILETEKNQFGQTVLGSSSTITVTVKGSRFPPSPTVIPDSTSILPTTESISTNENTLVANVNSNLSTTTRTVDQVTKENENGEPVIKIIPGKNKEEMIIRQSEIEVTTTLPIQQTNYGKNLSVVDGKNIIPIIFPKQALEKVKINGSFIIPLTIKIQLLKENDVIVYRLTGQQNVQIFNLFTIKLPITITLSATTGNILRTDETLALKILQFFNLARPVIR